MLRPLYLVVNEHDHSDIRMVALTGFEAEVAQGQLHNLSSSNSFVIVTLEPDTLEKILGICQRVHANI
jgi:hypothetical protein